MLFIIDPQNKHGTERVGSDVAVLLVAKTEVGFYMVKGEGNDWYEDTVSY